MSCPPFTPAAFRCPTLEECREALLALLPRGRAWQSHDGGPLPRVAGTFDASAFDTVTAFEGRKRPGSIIWAFFAALAHQVHFACSRLCALREEFFCATARETHAEWMAEYGLPDACDPYPDLCAKVSALGGATCDYFAAVAARHGWSVECIDFACGAHAGGLLAGEAQAGGKRAAYLTLKIDTAASPAYAAGMQTPSLAGRHLVGRPLACGPDVSPIQCVMERIAPAHLVLQYEVY